MAVTATPVLAACDATAPASGATATCTAGTETDAIIAPGSTNVTVNLDPGAILQTPSSPTIDLGGGALIDMATGSRISDFDPSTLPATIIGVIGGDFSGITDQTTLGALFDSIQSEMPVRPTPAAATIEFGVADDVATQVIIHEITAMVTVNKAKMADLAMNAVNIEGTEYVGTGGIPRTPSVYSPTRPTSAGGTNTVFIDGGTVVSGGAAAIRTAGDSALEVFVTGDGAVASLTENAPTIVLDGIGGLEVFLSHGTVATFFDGAAGIALPSGDSALAVIMGDARILTAGDDAPAILGPGASSVFNLEVDRTATDTRPSIATFGDNSAGIFMHGSGSSTATLQFVGAGPGTNPAFQTSGANSTLIDMDFGQGSSLSLTAENTSFGTFGDGSDAMSLSVGSSSDVLVYMLDTTLSSTGANSNLLETQRGPVSILNTVAIRTNLTATGDGAGGMIFRTLDGGVSSSDTFVIAYTTIATEGDDAPAFLIEEGGGTSVRSVFIDDSGFSTLGENSAGVAIGGLGSGSAMEVTITDTMISTVGDVSSGVAIGGLGGSSALTVLIDDFDFATQGDDSAALSIGSVGSGSVKSVSLTASGGVGSLSTQGDNSACLLVGGLAGDNSVFAFNMNSVSIETLGADSAGIVIGTPALVLDHSFMTYSLNAITVDTAGHRSTGLALYGLGDGADNSDSPFIVTQTSIVTQGDDSTGLLMDVFGANATNSTNTVIMDNINVATSGGNSHGIVLGAGLGTGRPDLSTDATLSVANTAATTSGDSAHALVIGENTTLSLAGQGLTGATTSRGTIVSGTIDSFDGFVATGAGSRAVMNHGILYGTFTVGAGVVGNLGSTGLIESVGGPAIDLAGGATVELLDGSRLLTSGDDAPGILISDIAGGATTTLSATGSTLQSTGNNSTLVDVDVGDASSVSFSAEDSSFATIGDGSGVVRMMAGYGSDLLIIIDNVTLTSEGDDATLLETSLATSSLRNVVVTNSTFSTAGNGSAGMIHTVPGTPGSSAHTFSFSDSSISTQGNDARGFMAEGIASSSSSGLVFFDTVDISTEGANSGAFFATAASDGSAGEITVTGSTFTTVGDNSAGFTVAPGGSTPGAGAAGSSVFALAVAATTVETAGDNSAAIIVAGAAADSSLAAIGIQDTTLRTMGADSTGLLVGAGASDDSVSVYSLADLTVETGGDRSIGIHLVDRGFGGGGPSRTEATLADLDIITAGTDSHGLVLGAWMGTEVVGSSDENELIIEGISATTSGTNAHAMVVGENTTLSLAGQNHTGATTANGTIVNGTIDNFDGFVATGTNSRAVMNNGILYGTFTVDDAVIGNLGNNGLIESAEGSIGVAVLFTGATNDIFELQTEGVVIGLVEAGAGTDTFILGGTGTQAFDVALIGTQYSGFEQFEKTGSSTWTLIGSSALFATPFLVREGTLNYNATFENLTLTIEPGGRAGGIGTVGELIIEAGGIVAPGNSIGTLTVIGNADFADGSIYEVEIRSGGNEPGDDNDLIVAGTATIAEGANFRVMPENGSDNGMGYAPSTTYTIIETIDLGADTLTVAGTGPTIEDTFAFLDFTGSHDGKNYYITTGAAAASFCLPGASFNQCQTGEAVRGLGSGNPAFDAVVNMSEASAGAAFNALSGEAHASGQHVIDQTFALFSGALGRNGAMGRPEAVTVPLGYGAGARRGPGIVAIEEAIDSLGLPQGTAAWLMPLGGRGTVRADGNAAQLDWSAAGLAGGYEKAIETGTGSAFGGMALGYTRGHGAVADRQSTLDVDAFYAGIYGGWADGPWAATGAMSVATNHVATERRISFGGIDETARASYWSQAVRLSGEIAYGFELDAATTLSPLFTIDAGWSGHGGFAETGAGALNLTGAAENWTRIDAGIGVAITHVMLTEHGEVTLDGRLVWEHAFADVVPSQTLAFAGSSTGFEVRGPDAGRDRLRLGLGVAFEATDDITIRAGYEGVFSGGEESQAVRFGLNVKF